MNAGAIYVSLGLDTKAFKAGIAGATQQMKTMGMQMQKVGKGMSTYLTAPLAIVGAASFKVFKEWETNLSKITGLVGVSAEQVDEWKQGMMDLAATTGVSAEKLADAMFFITSAGLRGADAMDALEYSAKAAAAGLGETEVIADLLTSAMNAYGSDVLSAAQATDILTATVREGKASAEEISGAMGNVLPIASAMGVEFEEVGGAIAAMTRTGTNANVAATQLKAIMSALINPTQEGAEALAAMGLSYEDLRNQLDTEGLDSLLLTLKDINDEQGIEKLGEIIPNIRAMSGVLDLVGSNAEDNMAIFAAMTDTTGSLDAAFLDASETAEFRMNTAMAKLKNTAITIGENVKNALIPIIEKLGNVMEKIGKKFAALSDSQKRMITGIAGITAAAGPMLMIFGSILSKAPALAGAFMKIGKAVKALGAAMSANPYLAIIAVIVVIIGLVATWGKTQEDLMKDWEQIKKSWKDVGFLKKAFAEYKKIWDDLKITFNELVQIFGKSSAEMDLFTAIFTYMTKMFKISITPLRTVVAMIKSAVMLFGSMIRVVKRVGKVVGTAIQPIVTKVKTFIGGIQNFISGVVQGISNFIRKIVPYIKDFIAFIGKIIAPVRKIFNVVLDAVSGVIEPLKKAFKKILEVVLSAVDPIIDTLDELGLLPKGLKKLRDNILGAKKDIEGITIEATVEVDVDENFDMATDFSGEIEIPVVTLDMDTEAMEEDAKKVTETSKTIMEGLNDLTQAKRHYALVNEETADRTSKALNTALGAETNFIKGSKEAWKIGNKEMGATIAEYSANISDMTSVTTEMMNNMASALESSLESMITSTVQTAAAGEGWKAIWMGLLGGVADLLVKLGSLAVAAGIAIEGIQEALKGNPGLAVAGGIALIALGAGIKAGLASLAEDSSNIQGLATGGIVNSGGVFKVGEQGEELVTLPRGAAVTPNHALNPFGNMELSTRFRGRDLEILLERATAQGKRR